MLNWNADKVKNLTPAEIWLFIIGRVLIAFGLGALLTRYYPQIGFVASVPVIVIGVILFLVAAKGLRRAPSA